MLRPYVKRYIGLLGPWCVLLLGLIVTAFGTRIAIDAGIEEARDAVARDADRIISSITTRVQIHEQMLNSAAALFAASDEVTRREWREYISAQSVRERFPDVMSLGFAELVRAGDRNAHETRIRREDWFGYEIRPAGERPLYLPLTYLVPDSADIAIAVGFDIYTEPTSRDTLDQAISSGRATLTGRLLPAEGSALNGLGDLMMYAPALRAGKVVGVAVASLRADLLMNIAHVVSGSDLAIRVHDGAISASRTLLFDGAPGRNVDAGMTVVTRRFIVGSRVWSIDVLAPSLPPSSTTRSMPLLVMLSGGAITYLAYLVSRILQRARMGERRFRDYAEMGTDWLWEHDRDLRFTFISSTRMRRAEVASAALGKTRRQITAPLADQEELAALDRFEAMMRAGKSFTGFEYSIRGRSGGREHFRISARPLLAPNGAIQGYRGVTQVITGERRREQELLDAKSAAEAASASKSRFLAMMSHELRTPLNAIIGFSDVIAELRFGRASIDRYAEYARIINRSGQQLLDLISQLLDMSKIEAGKLELVAEPVDLAEIARDCMKLLHDRAGAGGVTMREAFAASALWLSADRRALRQIVLNLVSNAVKFTPSAGTVTIALSEDADGGAIFSVADTGIGIATEAMAKICQPFHQADATIARRFGGTGLGLAISRALVEAHEGSLTMTSVVDRGTMATVRFPPARTLRGDNANAPQERMLASVAD